MFCVTSIIIWCMFKLLVMFNAQTSVIMFYDLEYFGFLVWTIPTTSIYENINHIVYKLGQELDNCIFLNTSVMGKLPH